MDTADTDRRLGAVIVLGTVALAGILAMAIRADSHAIAGWSFALAMVASGLLIVALHGDP